MTKRLEIAYLFAGLVGIISTWVGLFLPWSLVKWGADGQVLITMSGFSSLLIGSGIENLLVLIPLLAQIPCYILLLCQRNIRETSIILLTTGMWLGLQTLMWVMGVFPIPGISYTNDPAYVVNTGVYTTIMGSFFTMLAGLLSFLGTKITTSSSIDTSRKTAFESFIIKRFFISVVTLIGILIVIFWILLLLSLRLWGNLILI